MFSTKKTPRELRKNVVLSLIAMDNARRRHHRGTRVADLTEKILQPACR